MTQNNRLFLTAVAALGMLFAAASCHKADPVPEEQPFERYTADEGIRSTLLKREVRYSIYLPENYDKDTDKRYPVVYMLHGYGEDNNSWNGKYLHAPDKIQALERSGLSDMIYVFPQGFNTYYCNFHTGAFNYMDMFVTELMPFIDSTYRTIPDREHRCVTGYSMGGFGAMALASQHPEAFLCCAGLSMSFRTDAQYMAEPQSGWDNQWGNIFGGKGQAGEARLTDYYKKHCPYYCFNDENRSKLNTVKWYFTCGDDEEQLLIANDSLHVILRERGFEHEFRVENGAHTASYWMSALNEVLPMFDYYMKGGKDWPGIDSDVPRIGKVELDANGCFVSSKYKKEGSGKVLYLYHNSITQDELKKFIYLMQKEKGAAFAIVPCDINNKSIASVIAGYEKKFPATEKWAVVVGDAGDLAFSRHYDAYYLVDAYCDKPELSRDSRYYFVCGDRSSYYTEMDWLYKECKLGGYNFSYRVIKSSVDQHDNYLRLFDKINQLLSLY